jgi:hypothetical protein
MELRPPFVLSVGAHCLSWRCNRSHFGGRHLVIASPRDGTGVEGCLLRMSVLLIAFKDFAQPDAELSQYKLQVL